jgi:hypothetical protein
LSELELALKEVAQLTGAQDLIVVGSKSIHGSVPDAEVQTPELCVCVARGRHFHQGAAGFVDGD